ncbi:MAG: hypothetical protein AAGG07_12105 [Planctomycetota bacterium]
MPEPRPMPEPRDGPIWTPPTGPPANANVPRDVYERVGEEPIRDLLRDFYRRLAESPVAYLFPTEAEELAEAAERSADFFVFLLGGPPLYQQRHGPPMMRARHMPFAIDLEARNAWMGCFVQALDASIERGGYPADRRDDLVNFLRGFSLWMVNVEPGPDPEDEDPS